ncbi:hypothetical protein Tco_1263852 [Tanacetum coccineum]
MGFEESGTYYNKKDTFPENYVQPEEHDTLYQGQKGGHHGSDYRMRKLKMPLIDGMILWMEHNVKSKITVSFMGRVEEKVVGEIGTFYEQFMAITQEGLRPELLSQQFELCQPEGLKSCHETCQDN